MVVWHYSLEIVYLYIQNSCAPRGYLGWQDLRAETSKKTMVPVRGSLDWLTHHKHVLFHAGKSMLPVRGYLDWLTHHKDVP